MKPGFQPASPRCSWMPTPWGRTHRSPAGGQLVRVSLAERTSGPTHYDLLPVRTLPSAHDLTTRQPPSEMAGGLFMTNSLTSGWYAVLSSHKINRCQPLQWRYKCLTASKVTVARLFVQQFVQVNNKRTVNASHYCPLWKEYIKPVLGKKFPCHDLIISQLT